MKNQTIASYGSFNSRRYSNPWVAICNDKCQPDFAQSVGSYTGAYNQGEAGDLIVYNPKERAVYMYGQKDYRNSRGTERAYAIYHSGTFYTHDKGFCLRWLARTEDEQAEIIIADINGGETNA